MFFSHPRRITLPRPAGSARRWATPAAITARGVRVTDIRRETDDAVTLTLATEDGRPLPFRAGQYLTHCFNIDGAEVRRAYSLSVAEGEPPACTVKLLPGGLVSQYVVTRLKIGARYRVLGPSGDFVLTPGERGPLVMLAAGSGITPIISLIETALRADPQRRVRLLYINRDPARTLFDARLRAAQARYPRFEWTPWYTASAGRPDAARLAELLQPEIDAQIYLCGPQPLMDAATAGLRAAGVAAARIRRERFIPAPRHQQRPTAPVEIRFLRSGRTIVQRPGESILEAGLRAGLALPFSCTVGGCGHCRVRIRDGEVCLDEPNCLSADERAAGWTLACSACALTPLTVDA
ncbi:ring-1,2-phenylacetyl-CoA epoxidase subunit PaaE [Fontimonas thermophila]|uniref:Ring-1,2-phenylacetyl-CoA epoxidase subunit PaaE n=1 Tax=Fontimonas thermophila TaxID=1076937 RepID=A0A1I2JEN7_9GAMM|nr:ferredoxin--NADP reductase [Fontimonas thermophila]SFF53302.1 ring-1,2-phenylacetyl-CoA epoxidase subunit PaaE [Fontimonas thermophila]